MWRQGMGGDRGGPDLPSSLLAISLLAVLAVCAARMELDAMPIGDNKQAGELFVMLGALALAGGVAIGLCILIAKLMRWLFG